jgi:hypothetical protein
LCREPAKKEAPANAGDTTKETKSQKGRECYKSEEVKKANRLIE